MNMVASAKGIPIAGLAAAPTVFGTNLYLRPATGVHLPTFAEQALAWNAHSAAPAERIVIKAEQWNAAPTLPSTDAEQLSRLAQRFQTAIDLKSRSGVQEFVSAEELSRQEAVGSMAAAGTKKLGGFMLKNKIREWLLEERRKRLDEDALPDLEGHGLRDDFSGYESHVLARHLLALTLRGEKDFVRIEAVREILNLGRNCRPEGVSDDQWKDFHVDIIQVLVAMKSLPQKAGRLLQKGFEYHSYVPGDAADRNELEDWAWMRDVFIRVLNDPDEARRKRARDFFDAHEWIKDARPIGVKSLAAKGSFEEVMDALRQHYCRMLYDDLLVNDVYRALSRDGALVGHAMHEVLMLARRAKPAVIAQLTGELRDEDPHVVRVAAAALGRIDDVFHQMTGSGRSVEDAIAVRNAVIEVLRDGSVKEEHRFSILHEFILRASEDSAERLLSNRIGKGPVSKALNHTLERI